MKKYFGITIILIVIITLACTNQGNKNQIKNNPEAGYYTEPHRPQIHFSPQGHWMNDPNGLVFSNGQYHLFYQYYPDSSVWGPMHWGHAISKDLIHWKHLPVALYPDSLGCIFSGSAVVDVNNTSGLGKDGKGPLVAMFTYHDFKGEKAGTNTFQNQAIAYSNDEGMTWTKYDRNPVVRNPGIRDFRDPKVMWHEASKKWVLTLATFNTITFFSSPDLKTWTKESEFGEGVGQHGAAWECPDLFRLKVDGTDQEKWVLLVSINPGGPNGGSATQYFVGEFDGKVFHNESPSPAPRWMDYGKDNYAGVSYSGIPQTDGRRLLIGWMSNWQYASKVPTPSWRGAMTLPRELTLKKLPSGEIVLNGYPTAEFENYGPKWQDLQSQTQKFDAGSIASFALGNADTFDYSVELDLSAANQATIQLANSKSEVFDIVLDKTKQQVRINRNQSGETAFSKEFPVDIIAPANINNKVLLRLVVDQASVELFMDGGLLEMTNIVYPKEIYNQVMIKSDQEITVLNSKIRTLTSIWR
jgi:fructan beta-fructosidase